MLHNSAFGLIESIKFVALAINVAFGRIDVFTNVFLLFCVQHTATKGYHTPRNAMNREYNATTITIKDLFILCLEAQSRFE